MSGALYQSGITLLKCYGKFCNNAVVPKEIKKLFISNNSYFFQINQYVMKYDPVYCATHRWKVPMKSRAMQPMKPLSAVFFFCAIHY